MIQRNNNRPLTLLWLLSLVVAAGAAYGQGNTWLRVETDENGIGCTVIERTSSRALALMDAGFSPIGAIPSSRTVFVNLGTDVAVEIALAKRVGAEQRISRWQTVLAGTSPGARRQFIPGPGAIEQAKEHWIRLTTNEDGVGGRVVSANGTPLNLFDMFNNRISSIPGGRTVLVSWMGQANEFIRIVQTQADGRPLNGPNRTVQGGDQSRPNAFTIDGPRDNGGGGGGLPGWVLPATLFVLIVVVGAGAVALVLRKVTQQSGSQAQGTGTFVHEWPNYLTYRYPQFSPVGKLSVGGMGTIFVVRNASRGRAKTSVVKVLHPQFSELECPESLRFLDEARVLSVLGPTGISPQVHQMTPERPQPGVVLWFEMEYLEGWTTLRSLIGGSARRTLPLGAAVAWMDNLFSIIIRLHANGVIHRDLSPENLMINPHTGKMKAIDFGLAKWSGKHFDDNQLRSAHLTQPGEHVGKPRYCAPEQWRDGLHAAGPAADLYSLGVICFEMLMGAPPFQQAEECLSKPVPDFPPELMNAARNGQLQRLELVRALLSSNPDHRIRAFSSSVKSVR